MAWHSPINVKEQKFIAAPAIINLCISFNSGRHRLGLNFKLGFKFNQLFFLGFDVLLLLGK